MWMALTLISLTRCDALIMSLDVACRMHLPYSCTSELLQYWFTPLMLAGKNNHHAVVDLLLARPDVEVDTFTEVPCAAKRWWCACVHAFIRVIVCLCVRMCVRLPPVWGQCRALLRQSKSFGYDCKADSTSTDRRGPA